MTEAQKQQAVDAAQKARREFFADDPAVGTAIFRMCAKYNVEVNYGIHGDTPRKDGDKYILKFARHARFESDYCRIAHEIGHIILGHGIETMCQPVSDDISDEDRQANIFAANLLMPEDEFRKICKEHQNNVYCVAAIFGVTKAAAGVRMAILGIGEEQ